MHIAITNFYLLQVTGPQVPADLDMKMEIKNRKSSPG